MVIYITMVRSWKSNWARMKVIYMEATIEICMNWDLLFINEVVVDCPLSVQSIIIYFIDFHLASGGGRNLLSWHAIGIISCNTFHLFHDVAAWRSDIFIPVWKLVVACQVRLQSIRDVKLRLSSHATMRRQLEGN